MKRLLLLALALLGVIGLAGAVGLPGRAVAQQSAATTDTLTVSGTGIVSAAPDEAQMSFGVETRGATARAAVAANAGDMRKVIAALREAGGREITTQWVSVYPYAASTGSSDSNGSIDGFVASNSVSVTSTVGDAAALIDAATEAGANQVSGPGLSSSGAEALYRQALAKAVDEARAHAEVLARAAGREVGPITAIVEGGATAVPVYAKADAAAASTPIEPGQQDTSATVTVTFSLR